MEYNQVLSRCLIHHQGTISPPRRDLRSGVAFDRSSPRLRGGRLAITAYASVVAPRRLTSNTLLVIRKAT